MIAVLSQRGQHTVRQANDRSASAAAVSGTTDRRGRIPGKAESDQHIVRIDTNDFFIKFRSTRSRDDVYIAEHIIQIIAKEIGQGRRGTDTQNVDPFAV